MGAGTLPTPSGRSLPLRFATLTVRICAASLVASSWVGEGRAAAQTTPPASPRVLVTGRQAPTADTVPSEVGLVQVEVVVTDDLHNPVTGLPAEAFHLEEDGTQPSTNPAPS